MCKHKKIIEVKRERERNLLSKGSREREEMNGVEMFKITHKIQFRNELFRGTKKEQRREEEWKNLHPFKRNSSIEFSCMKTRMAEKKFAEKNAVALCLKKFISTAKCKGCLHFQKASLQQL